MDLHVFPPRQTAPTSSEAPLVLLISGEGGWRSFDDLLTGIFQESGHWVAGVDAMRYFWKPQDDRAVLGSDMRAFLSALEARAGRKPGAPVLIAGFSFGADLAPFVAGAKGWGRRVQGLVMVSPDETGSLEFRLSELLGFDSKEHVFSVASALRDVAGVPALLLHGGQDTKSAAELLAEGASPPKHLVVVEGANHHFTGREDALRKQLLAGLEWIRSAH